MINYLPKNVHPRLGLLEVETRECTVNCTYKKLDCHLVLVIDDDPDIRETTGCLLINTGFEVVTAANGKEALTYLWSRRRPSCILCDLSMPVMDGYEFARTKNADPMLYDIPLIVVSGVANLEKDPGALKAAAVLRKPVEFGNLLALVQSFCA